MSYKVINNNQSVTEHFEKQVQKTPHLTALQDTDHRYSYTALNEKANQFAHWLIKNAIKPNDYIAVLLEPKADFIICILAIIKIGAVYVPLDTMVPEFKLKDIINNSNPTRIITNEKYRDKLSETNTPVSLIKHIHLESATDSKQNVRPALSACPPIYLMYTSGSTGKPKGIVIAHQAVVNLVKIDNYASITQGMAVAQFSNPAFDACTFEIWSALLNGASLVIIPSAIRTNHNELKHFLSTHKIDCLFLPTGYFHQLIKSFPDTLDKVAKIMFGGEQVNPLLLKQFLHYRKLRKEPITLINGYGPTEATTCTTRHVLTENTDLPEEELMSIGQAITNVKTYVLDENKKPSIEGELYISGLNLALGYHHSKQHNQEKFIPNPFETEERYARLYKTGDKVRLLPSGNLLCLGRLDDQVKIGGFRIHLNEVENELMQHEAISLAAVVVETGGGLHKILTAYIVFASKKSLTHAEELRKFLSLRLPPYMLPGKYVVVDELPLNLIGKIDKKNLDKLPHMDLSFHVDSSSVCIVEETIKAIWKILLNRSSIETHKNLFELGANSLLMTEACARINKELHAELQISDLLTHPTIHRLSRFLEGDLDDLPIITRKQPTVRTSDIAIIGMSCRFPGANSLDQFWENLCQGNTSLQRFNEQEVGVSKLSDPHFVPVKGILSGIDQFDAQFFGFSPMDASITDPQQRLFLECAWEAFEHAGIIPNQLDDKIISVFAGMADSTYLHENLLKNTWAKQELDRFQQRIASSLGMLSTQVSYRLNLTGRSLNINTACSTGLVSVAEACKELSIGTSDIALAGAVSIVVPQMDGYYYHRGGIESPSGECRPFEARAQGTVFSNGLGVVILKRLADALVDNDTIYAVIKGTGVNNDGSDKLAYTAPSVHGQTACIREALKEANIKANEIAYLEAHGTATALGDVAEIEALATVYREHTSKKNYCALGSVKGNIGHTDVAAGIAGLIKTVLCLYHEKIPPMPHFETPNSNIDFAGSPFFINSTCLEWKKKATSRFAGVSSFGVGGTNVHMILSEHGQETRPETPPTSQLLVLSAKTEKALQQNKEHLIDFLQKKQATDTDLADIAYTLQTGRDNFSYRCFSVGKTVDEILANFSLSQTYCYDEGIHPNVIFMFPGQGMQYPQMARELMANNPVFASVLHNGARLATPHLGLNLLDIINHPNDERLHITCYAQPALFIIEYALAHLFMYYGLKPHALIGHSIGEYVAACLSGIFSFEDAIALVCQRGLLMAKVSPGEMLAVTSSKETIIKELKSCELALHNAINHCVVAGCPKDIADLKKRLNALQISYRQLNVSHAFHSRSMKEIKQAFQALFSNITLSTPKIPMVSNVTGTWLSNKEALDANYWYQHLRQTVQFCQGIETLLEDKHLFFIEVGPGQSLTTFLKEMAKTHNKAIHCVTTLCSQEPKNDIDQFLHAIGNAWQQGIPVSWSAMYKERPRHVPLPTYAFQRQRYWVEPNNETLTTLVGKPQCYQTSWSNQRAYLNPIPLHKTSLRQQNWLIFADSLGLCESLVNLLKTQHVNPIIITPGKTYSEQNPHWYTLNISDKTQYQTLFKRLKQTQQRPPLVLHLNSFTQRIPLPTDKQINEQLHLGFYSILALTQGYYAIFNKTPIHLAIITSGSQQVIGNDPINPIQAMLASACRVIMQEHENMRFKLIDIQQDEVTKPNPLLFQKLIDSCMDKDWSTTDFIIPLRHGYQWHLDHTPVPSTKKTTRLQDKGIYVLTGGLGGLSLSFCEAIASTVSQPTFILLSRRSMPPPHEWASLLQNDTHPHAQKIGQLHQLQKQGANFVIHSVDISDLPALQTIVNTSVETFGKINGLIHTAGITAPEFVQYKSEQSAKTVLLPKLHGTYHLIQAFSHLSLDFVVLSSSLSALLGGFRHSDYSAANAALDAFAQSELFSFASFVVSINWNTWRDTGMAAEAAQKGEDSFLGKGNDISAKEGKALFLSILEGQQTQVAVSNMPIELAMHKPNKTIVYADSFERKMSRQGLPRIAEYVAPSNSKEMELITLWEDTLGIEQIGINDNFFALGGHSLKALTLIDKINKAFNSHLIPTQIYCTPTIYELVLALEDASNGNSNTPTH